jgi:hypothetical protein
MQETQRRHPWLEMEPGFSSFLAKARISRSSSDSKSRFEMVGGGARRSTKVPLAVSMNMGPRISRTAGAAAGAREGVTIRGAGAENGRAGRAGGREEGKWEGSRSLRRPAMRQASCREREPKASRRTRGAGRMS